MVITLIILLFAQIIEMLYGVSQYLNCVHMVACHMFSRLILLVNVLYLIHTFFVGLSADEIVGANITSSLFLLLGG